MTTKIKSSSLDNNIITTSHLHTNFSVDSDKIAATAIGPSELNQAANYTFTGTVAGAGANVAVGASGSRLAASARSTTDSGSAVLSTATVEVSVGAKDASGQTVIRTVSTTGHTHGLVQPALVMNYIIKT